VAVKAQKMTKYIEDVEPVMQYITTFLLWNRQPIPLPIQLWDPWSFVSSLLWVPVMALAEMVLVHV